MILSLEIPSARHASTYRPPGHRRGLAADQPDVPGPPDRRHRDRQASQARGQHGRQREREQQRRERQEDVGHPHDQLVDPAAEEPGRDSQRNADQAGDRQDDHRDDGRHPRAEQDPGEDVAPDLIGTEPVCRGRRLEHRERIGRRSRVAGERSDQRREESDQHDQHHDRAAHGQQRVGAEARPQRPAAGEVGLRRPDRLGLDHRSLILGSMPACTTSTTRFATTYATATNSVTPRIAGVSSVEMDAAA